MKKLALVGAGSLGMITGALLTKQGYDIDLIDADPDHIQALNTHGAQIGGFLEETIPVTAKLPEQAEGPYDLVFLLTKQVHTEQALTPIIPLLKEGGLVCTLQNGTPEDSVAALVGRDRTLVGNVMFAAEMTGPGKTLLKSPLDFVQRHSYDIGELNGTITDRVRSAAEVLSAAGHCKVVTNIIGSKWAKLIMNTACSGMSAALGVRIDELPDDPVLAQAALTVFDECLRTAEAHGVTVEPLEGKAADRLRADGPSTAEERLEFLQLLAGLWPGAIASMLQDMQRGIPSEKDFIPGRVVEVAALHNVDVPVTKLIYRLITEAESTQLLPTQAHMRPQFEKLLIELNLI